MATIVPIRSDFAPVFGNQAVVFTWTLAQGDDGLPISGPGWADRSFQIGGTFGGATALIEGSNDGGSNYVTLNDPFGNPLTTLIPILKAVTEITALIRPRLTGGDGTTSVVISAILVQHGLVS
jgi:hypothetical protein